jgi:transposase-like protein
MNLATIYERFPGDGDCIAYLERLRWPGKPICPRCGLSCSTPRPKELRHRCNRCPITYSVTVRTVFQGTHVPLQKWFLAIAIVIRAGRGQVRGRTLAKELKVNKNTACQMLNRIELAFLDSELSGLLKAIIADFDPEHPLLTLGFAAGGQEEQHG